MTATTMTSRLYSAAAKLLKPAAQQPAALWLTLLWAFIAASSDFLWLSLSDNYCFGSESCLVKWYACLVSAVPGGYKELVPPPLLFWISEPFLKVLGPVTAAFFIPQFLFWAGCMAIVGILGRNRLGAGGGWLSMLIFSCSLVFTKALRGYYLDYPLVFAFLLAVLCFERSRWFSRILPSLGFGAALWLGAGIKFQFLPAFALMPCIFILAVLIKRSLPELKKPDRLQSIRRPGSPLRSLAIFLLTMLAVIAGTVLVYSTSPAMHSIGEYISLHRPGRELPMGPGFIANLPFCFTAFLSASMIGLFLPQPFGLLVLAGLIIMFADRKYRRRLGTSWIYCLPWALLFFTIPWNLAEQRYMLAAVPEGAILAAFVLKQTSSRGRLGLCCAFLAGGLILVQAAAFRLSWIVQSPPPSAEVERQYKIYAGEGSKLNYPLVSRSFAENFVQSFQPLDSDWSGPSGFGSLMPPIKPFPPARWPWENKLERLLDEEKIGNISSAPRRIIIAAEIDGSLHGETAAMEMSRRILEHKGVFRRDLLGLNSPQACPPAADSGGAVFFLLSRGLEPSDRLRRDLPGWTEPENLCKVMKAEFPGDVNIMVYRLPEKTEETAEKPAGSASVPAGQH